MSKRWTPKPPAAGQNKFERKELKVANTPDDKITQQATAYGRMIDRMMLDVLVGKASKTDYSITSVPAGPDSSAVKQWLHKVDQSVSWDAVIGNQQAKDELREAIEAASLHADLYKFYEMKPPKGVLLYGPPGCGKTMFAKAAVTALGASEYLLLNGDELQSKWAGETEERIRQIFAYARAYKKHHGKPLLIFLDEAEAAIPARNEHQSMWRNNQVNQWLSELDGLNEYGAFLIVATNRPDSIDQAMLRDGRIDRKIKIKRPGPAEARIILGQQINNSNIFQQQPNLDAVIDHLYSNDFLIQELINPATNSRHRFLLAHIISGAMVAGLLARAKSLAFRRDIISGAISGVTTQDLLDAVALVFEENVGLSQDYALREFIAEVALPAEAVKHLN